MSAPVVVRPHAIRSLWPMTTNGTPATVAPAISRPGVSRRARYQMSGAPNGRCGSLARSGLPLALWRASTTQLFEACLGPTTAGSAA